ncbi:L-fuco-beta-pyranose dehydrogenase [Acidisarcina polymorpha]|uniref:L-fuco-beta-pyranose dehydrogenase n=1 Tax=Acidisarcina polymorpha TaxID=2211140 RepID=A0A2Z5FX27_9BACT|nr:FAD-binding oxidoreductase [Acidisarcina polymorpha]AXC10946.1 L-fuco-beta-pyranose dehydrogenase [Acidisarcina polymorpha]
MSASKLRQKKSAPAFESWGRYPRLPATLVPLYWMEEFPPADRPVASMLPVGMGRSYGDVCLLENGTLLHTTTLDRFIGFDPKTGLLRCEAGVTLAEILKFAVPLGWFLPVTPGTKFVTVGGAIANDIHGKNHHVAGTFGRHVPRFELVRSDGMRLECSPIQNSDWYAATIGGMGLTGLITWAEVQLRPIVSRKIVYHGTKFVGVDAFLELSQGAKNAEYSVAWIDCVAQGKNFARGIFMRGDHSPEPSILKPSRDPRLTLPVDLPSVLLNKYTVEAFNALYYRKQLGREKRALVDYEPFFYPLDSILHWNRLYGKDGLLQFQCVLPFEDGQQGILRILKAITSSGLASFLAVIKVFGDVPSPGMMSFPAPGITLALDFPVRRDVSFDLLERLAYITVEHHGKMYPAKDACMTALQFQSFYPQWREFAHYVDPAFSSSFWQRVSGVGAINLAAATSTAGLGNALV